MMRAPDDSEMALDGDVPSALDEVAPVADVVGSAEVGVQAIGGPDHGQGSHAGSASPTSAGELATAASVDQPVADEKGTGDHEVAMPAPPADANSSRNAEPPGKSAKSDKVDQPRKTDRSKKPAKAGKAEQPGKPAKPKKAAKAGKAERAARDAARRAAAEEALLSATADWRAAKKRERAARDSLAALVRGTVAEGVLTENKIASVTDIPRMTIRKMLGKGE